MADVFTAEKRSEVMARIRSSGTKPEKVMDELLRGLLGESVEFVCQFNLPGRPDFFVPDLNLAVFVDGCFFHACPIHGRIPDSNSEYWEAKIARNVHRGRSARRSVNPASRSGGSGGMT